jgi:flagellar biosynthesis/type III secretory pathway M-ring protein FliF/YscJ
MYALTLLLARWNALPRAARVLLGAGAFGALALSIAAAIVAHPPRAALFAAPLHPEQLGEVEEQLASWNVVFTPTADNVVVDATRRNDLLLRLSLAGVPHPHLSSTGEALASIGVLTPQSVVDAQTRAGLAGDIEGGLRGIDGVDDARVIVAPAKAPEFADESAHDASASVRLRLRDGARLSKEAIDGIRAFVAASVPELQPAHVTILDDRGVALGDRSTPDGDADGLQSSLQSALDAAFGDGTTIVRVRAEYASERSSERDFRRTPIGAPAIAGTRRSESYDGGGRRYRRLEEGEDRGSETHEVLSQSQPGALKRLATAVFVDQSGALDIAKVRDLAAAAVGFDARRGDLLAVEAVDFRRAPMLRKDAWWLLYGAVVPLAPALIVTVGLVFCVRLAMPSFASFLQSLLERVAVDRTSKAAAGFAPARVRSMLEQEPPHAAAAIISALPAATATAVLELYPPHEREAIVRRMQRRHSPLIEDAHELLRKHV